MKQFIDKIPLDTPVHMVCDDGMHAYGWLRAKKKDGITVCMWNENTLTFVRYESITRATVLTEVQLQEMIKLLK